MSNPTNTIDNGSKDPNQWTPISGDRSSQTKKAGASTGSEYNILSYPSDLGTPRYPYYMLFYINSNSASSLGKSKSNEVKPIQNSQAVAKENKGGQAASGNAQDIAKFLTGSSSNQNFITSYKRLDLVIALPMPQQITFGQSAGYNEVSGAGLLGTLLKDVSQGDWLAAGADVGRQALQGITSFGVGKLAELVGEEGDAGAAEWKQLALKAQGVAKNQRKEQVFQGMNTREFTFSWMFIPKTKTQSDDIRNIIKWIKFNQYPEIDYKTSGGLQVIIPNEFDLEFRFFNRDTGEDNVVSGIPKITTCILKNVEVNYTAMNKFMAFDGTDNPVATQVSLTFSEVEPLTRAQIGQGY